MSFIASVIGTSNCVNFEHNVAVTGADNNTRLLFYNVLYYNNLFDRWPVLFPTLGAYSQNDHLISLVMYNKLYKSILFPLCIINLEHVGFVQKLKINSQSTCPCRPFTPQTTGKPWQRVSPPRQHLLRQTSLEANWSDATLSPPAL